MHKSKYLSQWLAKNANNQHYLFTIHNLKALCPALSNTAFKTMLSRAVCSEILLHLCRGLYLFKPACPADGLLLFHAAAMLRSNKFNYISLETVLSDQGIISQIPINWVSIMSSGRSSIIHCGSFGTIEFVHTNKKPDDLMQQLSYDNNCGLWRANISLALRDMKVTKRNCDLIDWGTANELI